MRRRIGNAAVAVVLMAGLYLSTLYSYVLFHALIELFTIVVAAGVFVIAWNARSFLANAYLRFVGIASLFVALVDVFHTLAYQGMGVFAGSTANIATQFWIAGRLLESGAVVVAPFLIGRRGRPGAELACLALITAAAVSAIFAGVFPTCYVDGAGLTAFKVGAEYAIAGAFVAAAALLYRQRSAFALPVWRLLAASLALSVAAELAFTTYVSVYGPANMVGHFLRLVASFLLYKAIIQTALVQPYQLLLRELKESESRLQQYAADLERKNLELHHATRELAERNQELDAFGRTVAHDLKAPVSVIAASAQTLTLMSNLPPERTHRVVTRILSAATSVTRIIDNLLLLARVRKEEAPRTVVDMAGIVATARDRFEELIRETNAQVSAGDEWPDAYGHAPWIEQVWSNYLSNALQHAGPNPQIELGATRLSDGMVRFWVRDHGPGLSAEQSEHLFRPFYASARGHGLGLSIVAEIVAKMGGQAGVRSQPGQGSEFYFSLPGAGSSVPQST